MQYTQVVTTTDSEESALHLARGIVSARLGACVQMYPIRSFFWWDGDVQDEPEWQLMVKTSEQRLNALMEHITAAHTYDVPEIIATAINGGYEPYLSWIGNETRSSSS